MARKKQSRGNCAYCGVNLSKSGITKHLSSCDNRIEAIETANPKSVRQGTFYHLQVQDCWNPGFWLHLEMDGNASLKKLDDYLRAIWLECCGHLSEFSIGKWTGNNIAMSRKAGAVFRIGMEIDYVYDFGTSSELSIKVVNAREGKSTTRYPIALMARNDPPEALCVECGKPASWLCIECLYEHEQEGVLCGKHAKNHPHENYGDPMPLLNSPRVGMCGYDGPADPPY